MTIETLKGLVDLGTFRGEGGYFGEVKVDTYPGKLTVCLDTNYRGRCRGGKEREEKGIVSLYFPSQSFQH